MHDRTQIDGGDLDRHVTNAPDWDDQIAEAEGAVLDANKRWLRDNYPKIKALFRDWENTIEEAWVDNTLADFDDEFMPLCGIAELMEDADNEVKHYEYVKRQGRHLGNF